ncbi:alpha/beta hydrolase [Pseudomonas sp. P7548]|uniref:alpha/beta hydrolase n=1 Tax=Pseudomonas sp. P7548 TaxID=2726981 RepID=UPI0015BD5281|nr:alpha/beta hydrolase [Pseudomonas sp. P7548]NWE22485.1 alpha/beta hydrolase [Pseudomonas sp. P7548]
MTLGLLSWVCTAITTVSGTVFWLMKGNTVVAREGVEHVTLIGWVRVLLLRCVAPFFVSVSGKIGIRKLPARVVKRQIETHHGTVTITEYRPLGVEDELPAHFNFHGGGFVVGFARQDDLICRHIAVNACCTVINVHYAIAPEAPFPVAIMQACEVIERMMTAPHTHGLLAGNPTLSGFSAGGTIVAAVTQRFKGRKDLAPRLQVLVYPGLDFSWDINEPLAPAGHRSVLTPSMMSFFQSLYLPRLSDRVTALASPVLADDFSGLSPTLLLTAQNDLVRAGGQYYAMRLAAAGVNVRHLDFAGCDHGFTHSGPGPSAVEALDVMTHAIRIA